MSDPENQMDEGGVDEGLLEDDAKASGIASQLMQNPQMLAAIQGKLAKMGEGDEMNFFGSLPAAVKRRIKALKKLQADVMRTEGEFCKEMHELECKFAEKYSPLYLKRHEIVSGQREPTDSDCDWPSDEEPEEEDAEKAGQGLGKLSLEDEKKGKAKEAGIEEEEKEEIQGIPGFWLQAFKNIDLIGSMIQPHDEAILMEMTDLRVSLTKDPATFTLEFHFGANPYFSNTVLTKQYEMKIQPDETDPFSFEGSEIVKCKGCTINWEKGMNVTVKLVKKRQKHKGRGTTRTITKTVQNDSFFNFFCPPEMPNLEEENEVDEETETLLAADFEIGNFIRERLVTRAVLYYTGEAVEEDDFDEEGDEDDEDFDPEDDDDEDGEGDKIAQNQNCKQQ